MKHVNDSLLELETESINEFKEPSILKRLLMESDAITACILALDMFLVGIDTVCFEFQNG